MEIDPDYLDVMRSLFRRRAKLAITCAGLFLLLFAAYFTAYLSAGRPNMLNSVLLGLAIASGVLGVLAWNTCKRIASNFRSLEVPL